MQTWICQLYIAFSLIRCWHFAIWLTENWNVDTGQQNRIGLILHVQKWRTSLSMHKKSAQRVYKTEQCKREIEKKIKHKPWMCKTCNRKIHYKARGNEWICRTASNESSAIALNNNLRINKCRAKMSTYYLLYTFY